MFLLLCGCTCISGARRERRRQILLVEVLFQQTYSRIPLHCSAQEKQNLLSPPLPFIFGTNESSRVFLASVIHPVMFNPGF
jgi:hypothetical protein